MPRLYNMRAYDCSEALHLFQSMRCQALCVCCIAVSSGLLVNIPTPARIDHAQAGEVRESVPATLEQSEAN